ncbi:MAG: 30S ribosomal protein S10 [Bacteroidia bacterium]|nr:30S ribosomal protein S10 [Bacteroidia bacterium]MCX7764855.1 30S ribosomal protein S10 [Bacteroidia bacterium]MDW8057172.1 30S ribosomal protein S10 [Bacteroidia bacterium]
MTNLQRIRIKLKSYDHTLIDRSAERIVKAVKAAGAVVKGPIPLPTEKMLVTVNRSPHVNKESREQFQIKYHRRLIDIYNNLREVVDEISKVDLPEGVEVEIK